MSCGFVTNLEYSGSEYNSANQYQTLKCLSNGLFSPQQSYEWKVGKVNTLKPDETFKPSGSCKGGGLYFCNNLTNLSSYWSECICIVTIPDDARVWVEDNKAKTDKLFLKKIYSNLEFVKAYLDGSLQAELQNPLQGVENLHRFLYGESDKFLLFVCEQDATALESNSEMKRIFDEILKTDRITHQKKHDLETAILSLKDAPPLFARMILYHVDILRDQQDRIIQE